MPTTTTTNLPRLPLTLQITQSTYGFHDSTVALGPCNYVETSFNYQVRVMEADGMIYHVVEIENRSGVDKVKRWVREQFGCSFKGVPVKKVHCGSFDNRH